MSGGVVAVPSPIRVTAAPETDDVPSRAEVP